MKSKHDQNWFLLLTLIFCAGLCGCERGKDSSTSLEPIYNRETNAKKILLVGVPNSEYYKTMRPIIEKLNLGLKNEELRLVPVLSFEEYVQRTMSGYYDLVFTSGRVALKASREDYKIIAKFGDDSTYKAVIITRKDAGINDYEDLKGKKMALAVPRSILGDMAPTVYLKKNGIDAYKDLNTVYFTSFETGIENVVKGRCDAGASWSTMWKNYLKRHPEAEKSVEVKWTTGSFPNIAVLVKAQLDKRITDPIVQGFLNMHQDETGRTALAEMNLTRMEKADSNTYQVLYSLERDYEKILAESKKLLGMNDF